MEYVAVGLSIVAVGIAVTAWSRRRAADVPPPDTSEAVRRDLARLVQELQVTARDQVGRLDREVRRLKDAVAEAERARIALDEARSRPAPRSSPSPDKPSNPLHSRVFELRDSGKDPADIGVETGLEVGEVELILGLRRMPPRA